MDQIQLSQDVAALKKLVEEYDRQLKMVGIDLSDMPEDCVTLINKFAEIKSTTELHDLSTSYLDEFYCSKKLEQIKHKQNTWQLVNDIRTLEKEIENEKKSCKVLEDFANSVNGRIVSEAEMDHTKATIERKIEALNNKHDKSFNADFNIDALISKIELLEAQKK